MDPNILDVIGLIVTLAGLYVMAILTLAHETLNDPSRRWHRPRPYRPARTDPARPAGLSIKGDLIPHMRND